MRPKTQVRELKFPTGFLWGSATASLQVEGASFVEGRLPSQWDEFCRLHPERIHEGASPEIACDHYHRYLEDVGWMKSLGHNTYRFSVAWPRVVPSGDGALNQAGLDFYDRLVDSLMTANVEPNITLYHWDLPLGLANRGGWENPRTVDAFLRYAEHCFDRLADRVKLWSSINEPAWTVLNGYLTGLHPPCKSDKKVALLAAHHLLCAHTHLAESRPCGIALNLSPVYPATHSPADKAAATTADQVLNNWFLEAVLTGSYPAKLLSQYETLGIAPQSPHKLKVSKPSFLGVNYYYPQHARASDGDDVFHINNSGDPNDDCKFRLKGCFEMIKNPIGRYTQWAWEIDPQTLTKLLMNIHRKAPDIDIYVTENGLGLADELKSGEVDDTPRINFVSEHLEAIHQAISSGCQIKGYYMWSLMDNFSWINGYKKRYGFLHIDRQTLIRTPKKSAFWFKKVAEANSITI